MTDSLFYKLKTIPDFLDSINEFLASGPTWTWLPYMHLSLDFQKHLGPNITKENNLLKALNDRFFGSLRLYMFPAETHYEWHQDANIGCSLNLVLDDYDALTMFAEQDIKPNIIKKISILKYEKCNWYLFNSQKMHSVVNADPRDRILLTYTFPKHVKYDELLEFIKNFEKH